MTVVSTKYLYGQNTLSTSSICCIVPTFKTPVIESASFLCGLQTPLCSSTVCLPSVLCWHLKGCCGPQHLGVMPLGLTCPLSLSLPLHIYLPLPSGWMDQHNHVSRALPGQRKMDYVSSSSMAMLTSAKRGQQKPGRFGRYHFTNLTLNSQH